MSSDEFRHPGAHIGAGVEIPQWTFQRDNEILIRLIKRDQMPIGVHPALPLPRLLKACGGFVGDLGAPATIAKPETNQSVLIAHDKDAIGLAGNAEISGLDQLPVNPIIQRIERIFKLRGATRERYVPIQHYRVRLLELIIVKKDRVQA